jgi:pilus assembly protein CpaF
MSSVEITAPADLALGIDTVAEQLPLGGLERWMGDGDVTEIIVNGGGDVWIERGGRLQRVATMSAAARGAAVERLLAPLGRRLDRSSPVVDARLADGSRVCAVLPPVAVDGLSLCIRRFRAECLPVDAFAPPAAAALLRQLVAQRANLVICGATSSGKTTLLNALAAHCPAHQRLVTLEDIAELRIAHPHVLRLECRPESPDGAPEIPLDQLLRAALRMRPDRLIVGEIRGAEVLTLVHALNTGHRGSMATIHANSATDAMGRLRTLVMQTAPSWPPHAVDDALHRAIDAVIHVDRSPDGRREVQRVCRVLDHARTRDSMPAIIDHGVVVAAAAAVGQAQR